MAPSQPTMNSSMLILPRIALSFLHLLEFIMAYNKIPIITYAIIIGHCFISKHTSFKSTINLLSYQIRLIIQSTTTP